MALTWCLPACFTPGVWSHVHCSRMQSLEPWVLEQIQFMFELAGHARAAVFGGCWPWWLNGVLYAPVAWLARLVSFATSAAATRPGDIRPEVYCECHARRG